MTDETKQAPPAPPAGPTKKQLVLTEVENIEATLKGLFGGIHDEVAVIIARIRSHLG